MSHPLEGTTRILAFSTASAGAGATAVNMRPGQGCVWEVLWAVAWQNDGAVAEGWYFIDPDSTGTIIEATAGGANEYFAFGALAVGVAAPAVILGPITATYDRYPRFQFTASAGSKTGYIRCLVKEYRGVAVEA